MIVFLLSQCLLKATSAGRDIAYLVNEITCVETVTSFPHTSNARDDAEKVSPSQETLGMNDNSFNDTTLLAHYRVYKCL